MYDTYKVLKEYYFIKAKRKVSYIQKLLPNQKNDFTSNNTILFVFILYEIIIQNLKVF